MSVTGLSGNAVGCVAHERIFWTEADIPVREKRFQRDQTLGVPREASRSTEGHVFRQKEISEKKWPAGFCIAAWTSLTLFSSTSSSVRSTR